MRTQGNWVPGVGDEQGAFWRLSLAVNLAA